MDEEQPTPEEQKKNCACMSKGYRLVFLVSMIGLALAFFSLYLGWLPEAVGFIGLFLFAGPPGILFLMAILYIARTQ